VRARPRVAPQLHRRQYAGFSISHYRREPISLEGFHPFSLLGGRSCATSTEPEPQHPVRPLPLDGESA
jgi:hypothetical protein